MKKINLRILSIFLFILFIIGTIISLCIVYLHIETVWTTIFLIGYVIFLVVYLIYALIVTILNTRDLKTFEIKKRFYRFILYFILLSGISLIDYYFFRPEQIDFIEVFTFPFAISLGIAFFDLMFKGRKDGA